MKVSELIHMLDLCDKDCEVKMIRNPDDNPLLEAVDVDDAIIISSYSENDVVVILPNV